ncbi:AAA family ATPase [Chlorogloeopsis sp. ULAP02]|uniref:AAA family ATPase n=1 Tax=Chlorogloeopsis sp. ULAP02 TaxID=3107926 RepID=UPI00398B32F8
MLIEFSVENYRSFQERQTFSMVASEDETRLDSNTFSILNSNSGLRLLKSAVIYGANASGKSNLLRVIQTLKSIVVNSANKMQVGDKFPIEPFRLNSKSEKKPTCFEVIFLHKNIRYEYGLSLNRERVYEEWLIAYPNQRQQNWFSRRYLSDRSESQINEEYEWFFGKGLKGEKERIKKFVRPNSLFLSHAAQNNHPQLTEIFEWFQQKINIITPNSLVGGFTLKICDENSIFREQIVKLLNAADIGISDIKIESKSVPEGAKQFIKQLIKQETDFQEVEEIDIDEILALHAITLHKMSDSDREVEFAIEEESDGTQRLFELAGPWLYVLQQGEVLLVDELGRSLHPVLSKALVKMFNDSMINVNNAQLIFATQDTTLLDAEIFRQDQVWFTEKDRNMSKLYSLLDFRPLKDESLQKSYLLGRYGAIPFISGLGI